MSEIVKQLRDAAKYKYIGDKCQGSKNKEEYLEWQAADEIERLQKLVDQWMPSLKTTSGSSTNKS